MSLSYGFFGTENLRVSGVLLTCTLESCRHSRTYLNRRRCLHGRRCVWCLHGRRCTWCLHGRRRTRWRLASAIVANHVQYSRSTSNDVIDHLLVRFHFGPSSTSARAFVARRLHKIISMRSSRSQTNHSQFSPICPCDVP
jgi:hypothetical protein